MPVAPSENGRVGKPKASHTGEVAGGDPPAPRAPPAPELVEPFWLVLDEQLAEEKTTKRMVHVARFNIDATLS